jgi:hypothetical protein
MIATSTTNRAGFFREIKLLLEMRIAQRGADPALVRSVAETGTACGATGFVDRAAGGIK